ncbi:MAG TPA: Mur ligase family protein [Candidatus Saccharimonadales bacterium]|nr:Mur ligase family protein [Candidatus Saccharimonadales bacterium]
MLRSILFVYTPAFAQTAVYMLQSVEYRPGVHLKWLWQVNDFNKVAYRRNLVKTRPAKMLLWAFLLGELVEAAIAIWLFVSGVTAPHYGYIPIAVGLFLITPLLWAHLIILPLWLGDWIIIKPSQGRKISRAKTSFAKHPAVKIAIAGSYGKTTMKEILLTVLGDVKNVAATPANKNVSISHALFAERLNGDEDILIIEYGEGAPGDVARFAQRTRPTVGVITGLAPAHLDRYKTLKAAGEDIFSLADYLGGKEVYVSGDSPDTRKFLKKGYEVFSAEGIDGWKVSGVKTTVDGLEFNLSNGSKKLRIKSHLLGRHQVGPLALAAYLADKFGLNARQIESGIAKIKPFEHRMQPYQLGGAWIIDDTYNGNIEGMKAGLELLKELPAKRKMYVTPGLVDQGAEEKSIHIELGQAIKAAEPDQVVLMKHSVTAYIEEGLTGYKGQLVIEEDPLNFYTNLDKLVAAGDLVLLQNDWPDQYN